jgi:hypothetical protein
VAPRRFARFDLTCVGADRAALADSMAHTHALRGRRSAGTFRTCVARQWRWRARRFPSPPSQRLSSYPRFRSLPRSSRQITRRCRFGSDRPPSYSPTSSWAGRGADLSRPGPWKRGWNSRCVPNPTLQRSIDAFGFSGPDTPPSAGGPMPRQPSPPGFQGMIPDIRWSGPHRTSALRGRAYRCACVRGRILMRSLAAAQRVR